LHHTRKWQGQRYKRGGIRY